MIEVYRFLDVLLLLEKYGYIRKSLMLYHGKYIFVQKHCSPIVVYIALASSFSPQQGGLITVLLFFLILIWITIELSRL